MTSTPSHLDGQMDLNIEFNDCTMTTPIYIKMDPQSPRSTSTLQGSKKEESSFPGLLPHQEASQDTPSNQERGKGSFAV